jgi:hypothetical protein
MDDLTKVENDIDQIRGVNNITEGNVMRTAFNLGQSATPSVRNAWTNLDSTEGLQTALLPFLNDPNLYNSIPSVNGTPITQLIPNGLSLAETIYATFTQKYNNFLTKPLVTGGYGDKFFFKSAADRTEAEAKALEIIAKMVETLKTITVANAQEERERAEGESWNQVVCSLGKKYLIQMEKWRASQTDGIDMLQGQSGGVTKFFNEIVGFTPKSTTVRNMFERPAPPGQCNAVYKNKELEIITRKDFERSEYNNGGLGNPDGLAENRKPLWWKSVGEGTWIAPVTCYICETFLYETGVCRPDWTKCDNNMECEHLLPFLEAQLFWSLKMPGIILSSNPNYPNIVSREYAPVCRKCNGASHKTGLPILKLSQEWGGFPAFERKITLNNKTLDRISKNSREYPNAKGRKTHPTIRNHILPLLGRKERVTNVFRPIQQAVNTGFNNIDARRICEILILRYFFYFNKTTLDKVISELLNGEDVEKKKRLLEQHIRFVRKFCKKYKTITYKAEKNLSNFKRFLTKKRINFSKIKNAAGKVIKSVKKLVGSIADRMKMKRKATTEKNVQSNFVKNQQRLDYLTQHQANMRQVFGQINTKKHAFKAKYENIIDDPENYTFSDDTEKQTFASDALELETLSKNFINELGNEETRSGQWIGAGGAIIPYQPSHPVDDNIKNKAYYVYWLANHAVGIGQKYGLVVDDIMRMLYKNIEIDNLLLTEGTDYIEKWSMETSARGNLFSTRYWCSVHECTRAHKYYSSVHPAKPALLNKLKMLCSNFDQDIRNMTSNQAGFLERVYNQEKHFRKKLKKKEQLDLSICENKYIDSIKKGKKLQLFIGQKEGELEEERETEQKAEAKHNEQYGQEEDDDESDDDEEMEEEGILLLTKENQIKYDIFDFMIDIAYRYGGAKLRESKFYKRGCNLPWWEETALPPYLLDRPPDATETITSNVCSKSGKNPIEWVKCKTPEGEDYFLICSNFDVSLLEKEYEQVKDVWKGFEERRDDFQYNEMEEEAKEDVELGIDEADCPSCGRESDPENKYIQDWLSGNGLPQEARGKWGEHMLGDEVVDYKSLNKYCFPELYDFNEPTSRWTCQYEDSADEEEDEDGDRQMEDGSNDSGSNDDEKDDRKTRKRSDSEMKSDSSGDFPPIVLGGRRKTKTRRRKRRKRKKTRRKNKKKRRKKTKRRRKRRKKTRRRRR